MVCGMQILNIIDSKNMLMKFKDLENLKICVLGLTYKPNTSTLRRSISITQ